MVKCNTTGCEGVAIVSRVDRPMYCLECASCRQQPTERHDQQVDSEPLCGPDVIKTVEAVNKLKLEWDIEVNQPYTPEVGEECEFQSFIGNDWIKGVLLASTESYAILKSDKREHSFNKENVNFRPLKTERDIAIDEFIEINRNLSIGATERQMFEALYDAGLRIVK